MQFLWISEFKPEFAIIRHCVFVCVCFRQGGALSNEKSGALAQALNYFGLVVFQKNNRRTKKQTLNLMPAKGHFSYFGDKQDRG